MATILRLENVWKRYGVFEVVEAVKNVNLECEEGEFLSFLGPSGCGKTSTLRMIAGLEKISEGKIYIKDRVINDLKPGERKISMAFENYALYPPLTVYENIAFPLNAEKLSANEIKKRIAWIAELLQIEDILNVKPRSLSGGQQQRTSLARSLVKDADIYLMDEPISHLDADMRRRMRGELKRLHQTKQMTVVYVTHDQLEAMSMADRIAVMNEGIIRQLGTPDQIFNHPQDEFVAGFIGSPPINFLDCCLKIQDGKYGIEMEGFAFPLPDRVGKEIEETGDLKDGKVRLGVRPEDVKLSLTEDHTAFKGRVIIIEPVGENIIYRIEIAEKLEILAEMPADMAIKTDEGDKVEVTFDPERLHFFHPETGKALYT